MVVGELPSRSIVIVGDGDKFSCQWSIGVRRDNASGLGDGFRTVELVVGSENAGAVGIGFFQFQIGGWIVEPSGGVSVGSAGRIGGDVAFVCTEGSQGHHAVGFVIGKTGRLDGGAVLGRLSAADIIGVVGRASQSIGDASHGVTAGQVAGGGHVACRIGDFDSTSGKVSFCSSDIAATIGFFQNHPCRGTAELL